MSTPENPAAPDHATFRTRRVLPYPPQVVYDAFARPELLARWWGPNGFNNTFETFEFKPGGRWKFVMHGPDGANYPNENIFRELQAPSKLVIQHVVPPYFTLTVTLEPHETGTAITWIQVFDDAALAAQIRHIIEPANEQNLDRLLSVLMSETEQPIRQVFAAYKAAVFAKDVSAFTALYARDVRIFDLWAHWSCDGGEAQHGMIAEWFGSLGAERVAVDFHDVRITVSSELAVAHAFTTYQAISADGTALRAMTNRLTWAVKLIDGAWKIIHEHTSAPVSTETMKAILQRP